MNLNGSRANRKVYMNLKGIHRLFPNSEPPGRGPDIKEGPETVPLLRVRGSPWTTPLSDGTKPIFQMVT